MTDLPEGGPTEAAATDPATDPAEVGDVTALADDVARDNEQVRDGLAAVRDGLEQLRSQIQDANGLTLTSADLLSEFKQTADALNAERQQLEREKAALVSERAP